jgi:hypothetical protein
MNNPNIGLVITVNKFNHYWNTTQSTFVCDTLDNAKKTLVNNLASQFYVLNIDFPLELADFEYIWFNQQQVEADSFYYKVFMDGSWSEPWDTHDIYADVLDAMLDLETNNPPDFSTLYGEPNPDENADDKFPVEQSDEITEMEKKLTEIIAQSQTLHAKEDQVKECKCDQCKQR